jgi:hypothetical protein
VSILSHEQREAIRQGARRAAGALEPPADSGDLLDLFIALQSIGKVAERAGVSYETARQHLLRLGVRSPMGRRGGEVPPDAEIEAAYRACRTIKGAARATGGCFETVRRRLIAMGLHVPRRRP